MRLQLSAAPRAWALLALLFGASAVPGHEARADDKLDATTTLFQEQRDGGLGGLRVIHQQADIGADIGDSATLDIGYSADVVSGATAAVYQPDAISAATTFSDLRHEARLGLGFSGRRSSLAVSVGAGLERDYLSRSLSMSGAVDLPGKNTNLALAYSHGFDEVCDKDNAMLTVLERRPLTGADPCATQRGILAKDTPGTTVWRDIDIDTLQATVTQNLSPTTNAQASVFGQVIEGFQSNPYRRVRVGAVEPQESIPDVRARAALTVRVNRYLPRVNGAVHALVRGYSDTWGVSSGTAEMAYSQYAGKSLLFRLRARVYQQTQAVFFKDAFYYMTESTAGAYFTGDRELAPLRNILLGAKLSLITSAEEGREILSLFDRMQLNLKTDVLFLSELPSGDLTGNPTGIEDQFISTGLALSIQLGLLFSY